MSLAYQTKCENMFSYPDSDHIFLHSSVTYLVFFKYYVVIIHLLLRGGGVVIHWELIPD